MRIPAHAVAYAKHRSAEEVTPDDLLLGGLQAAARLGVAGLGPLHVDLSQEPPVPEVNGQARVRPRRHGFDDLEWRSALAVWDQGRERRQGDGSL